MESAKLKDLDLKSSNDFLVLLLLSVMIGMEMEDEDDDAEALLMILDDGALKQQGSCTRNPIQVSFVMTMIIFLFILLYLYE